MIRKLLRLAASPNVHEAARAREEAQRLMLVHGLTHDYFEEDVIVVADDRRDAPRQELARVIALSRRCTSLVNRRDEIAFGGRQRAAASAKRLYQALAGEAARHCDLHPNDPGRRVWRDFYWRGFVEGVTDRLRSAEARAWAGEPPRAAGEPPPPVPADIARPRPEAPPPPDLTPPSVEESRVALMDFAARFDPRDVRTGVQRLCDAARAAGQSHARRVEIEPYAPTSPSAGNLTAGTKNGGAS